MNLAKWTVLQSKLAFHHRWYTVRQDTVELPNGTVIDDYFLSIRPDVALVFPITSSQDIVFVRQYRHGAGEILLELPAGTFDPNQESAEAAALRELQEETGYTADRLIPLAVLYDNPVKETNKIHLFLAENAFKVNEQQLDMTEEIEIVLIPAAAAIAQVMNGTVSVSGSVAATFLGLNYLATQAAL
ncbi:NUDIX hydrolase [Oculatella sp. LEGE 06141]|uniref:NUDIX hydrolase n=1 Tax=Oculatella sp. LEGE 06141 TaxID=1828648 RepID=UPI00187FD0A8|nr:NUDIX hydrolase [Oculatella sp. LEGE 06141]MBE9178412.1 NUDIX hydrolase [Oculatella sp. LEGE 06141]